MTVWMQELGPNASSNTRSPEFGWILFYQRPFHKHVYTQAFWLGLGCVFWYFGMAAPRHARWSWWSYCYGGSSLGSRRHPAHVEFWSRAWGHQCWPRFWLWFGSAVTHRSCTTTHVHCCHPSQSAWNELPKPALMEGATKNWTSCLQRQRTSGTNVAQQGTCDSTASITNYQPNIRKGKRDDAK